MADEPVYMLNALWFKEDGGAAKYAEYTNAAGPFVQRLGGEAMHAFRPTAALQGEFDPDLMFFVRWPSFSAFEQLIVDPGYQAISHLRDEAIERAVLTRCEPVDMALG